MKSGISFALACSAFISAISVSQTAKADEWGCQVILCLANPGSPTEYAECVPPITKLYKHLAKGGSFPSCSGADFSTSHPASEPFECTDDYELVRVQDTDSHAIHAMCRSKKFHQVENKYCYNSQGSSSNGEWVMKDGKKVCGIFTRTEPTKREQPNYIDVTIKDGGKHRVWY
ncbi:hypothetical protein EDF68_11421 [Ochrobactrum sp. BH3]|nr:hypothetical protein EDF68_11421 [Ochrobactrum sp. BH3]